MPRLRTLALAAGLVALAAAMPAGAQRAATGEPLTGDALRQRISGRALVAASGMRINLYADGRVTVWDRGQLTTDGRWRMCGPTRICAQAEREGRIEVLLYPNGTGRIGGSQGGAFTVGAIDRARDNRPRR
jgi:hypothetical protein